MITCSRCGSSYEDDATYCNNCQVTLDNHNTHYLVDQKKQLKQARILEQQKRRLIYTLGAISLLFPFYAASRFFPLDIFGYQKFLWVFFTLLSAACALFGIQKQKNWQRVPIVFYIALLLPLLPIGTFCGAMVLGLWLQTHSALKA